VTWLVIILFILSSLRGEANALTEEGEKKKERERKAS